MNMIYGSDRSFPVAQSPIAGPSLAVLPPMPGSDSPTPRRRRTIVCSNLTIEGQTWDLEEAKEKMADALRGDKADLRCSKRPGVQIAADYASDVCLSSWCRNCPFVGSAAEPVIRYVIENPKPAPVAKQFKPLHPISARAVAMQVRKLPPKPAPPSVVPFAEMTPQMHADRIRATVVVLRISMADASRMYGMGDTYVADLVARAKVQQRLEDVDALLDLMLAARVSP